MDENLTDGDKVILNFIWTKKSGKSIRKEDGVDTYIVFSNKLRNCIPQMVDVVAADSKWYKIIIEPNQKIWLTNKTDAYFLNSNVKNALI